ncbi:hypothetical protein [Aquibacillus kalidii]|uniref:hypothetical protein n=1 Tax=Aquibacillus kalidii TaxID=2762597 RepID=UPI00164452FB|nr:hypothetical protein [Aquibacillus kalidii]
MQSGEETSNNSNRFLFICRNIILVAILLVAAQFWFDDIPTNDHIGWLAFVVFWTLRSLFDYIDDRKNGKNKSAIINLLLIVVGFGILIWGVIKYMV